ncbi:MAG: nickel insertion protein [Candidatus Limnocylindrales bacterium]
MAQQDRCVWIDASAGASGLVAAAALAPAVATFALDVLRLRPVARRALTRDEVVVQVEGCEARVKRGLLDGEAVTVQAEYSDSAAAAERLGLPVRTALERAAALARSMPPSGPAKPDPQTSDPGTPDRQRRAPR